MGDTVRVRALTTIGHLVYGQVATVPLDEQTDARLRSGLYELVDDDAPDTEPSTWRR